MKEHKANCPRSQFWDAGEYQAQCTCNAKNTPRGTTAKRRKPILNGMPARTYLRGGQDGGIDIRLYAPGEDDGIWQTYVRIDRHQEALDEIRRLKALLADRG